MKRKQSLSDLDEEVENNYQELLRKDQLGKEKFSCDLCAFVSKSEAGPKKQRHIREMCKIQNMNL
jgi:hypothetical protein